MNERLIAGPPLIHHRKQLKIRQGKNEDKRNKNKRSH